MKITKKFIPIVLPLLMISFSTTTYAREEKRLDRRTRHQLKLRAKRKGPQRGVWSSGIKSNGGQMSRARKKQEKEDITYNKSFKPGNVIDTVKKFFMMKKLADYTGFAVGLQGGFEGTVPVKVSPTKTIGTTIGGSLTVEFTTIKPGTYAFYCAPGVHMGMGGFDLPYSPVLNLSLIKIYGCYENTDYTGNFLTAGLGPVAHSWGASLDQFLQELETKTGTGEFTPTWLIPEFIEYMDFKLGKKGSDFMTSMFGSEEEKTLKSEEMSRQDAVVLRMACDLVKHLSGLKEEYVYPKSCESVPNVFNNVDLSADKLGHYLKNPSELTAKFPDVRALSKGFLEEFEDNNFRNYYPNLYHFVKAWTGQFSGCNSWSVGIGLKTGKRILKKKGMGAYTKYIKMRGNKELTTRSSYYSPSIMLTHYAKIGEGKVLLNDEDLESIELAAENVPDILDPNVNLEQAMTYIKEENHKNKGKIRRGFEIAKNVIGGCIDSMSWVGKDILRMGSLFTGSYSFDKSVDTTRVNIDAE